MAWGPAPGIVNQLCPVPSSLVNAKNGKVVRVPQLTRHFAQEPTWRWLTDVWDHADADWLGQEIFDIMKQASMRGDIENLVHCQASILATICPTGTPTRQYWLWSWRLAHHAAIDHRLRTQVRPLRGPVTAYS